ncbi:MAG: hypothetical protein HDP34_02255 [Clostridia bacterium]|nr:hypothetical protein [Clostridia bacterium]
MEGQILYVIILVVAIILGVVIFFVIGSHFWWGKPHSDFDSVYIGMPEQELIEELGKPTRTIIVDATAKVLIYREISFSMLIWAHYKSMHISIKNGVVTRKESAPDSRYT